MASDLIDFLVGKKMWFRQQSGGYEQIVVLCAVGPVSPTQYARRVVFEYVDHPSSGTQEVTEGSFVGQIKMDDALVSEWKALDKGYAADVEQARKEGYEWS